ncbi:hypothetical protein ACQ5SO_07030 [Rhodovulum sp. DZ06]|uniref:hypothetical protein n=1 Tax=Rhodovulum sp. DZ06 TaxID=3425126 RepID=UPI003D3594F3
MRIRRHLRESLRGLALSLAIILTLGGAWAALTGEWRTLALSALHRTAPPPAEGVAALVAHYGWLEMHEDPHDRDAFRMFWGQAAMDALPADARIVSFGFDDPRKRILVVHDGTNVILNWARFN